MTFTPSREAIAALWVIVFCGIGVALGLRSISDWMVVAAIGLAGLAVLYRLWRSPDQTLSESINSARR